jgi:hypothetical protein
MIKKSTKLNSFEAMSSRRTACLKSFSDRCASVRRSRSRLISCFIFCLLLVNAAAPCGPGFVEPLFVTTSAPESPYENFAAGKLGLVKPEYHRTVLVAAYRYLTGGTFSQEERKALVEVWNADFHNKEYPDNDVTDAVRTWVERRKDLAADEKELPQIYVERDDGGYSFFPNCTKNAFETATQTLSERVARYGTDSKDVAEWLSGQDEVFRNCTAGKSIPNSVGSGAPTWLQQDRKYQIAAAEFYSLDFSAARRHWAEIAADPQSPWAETADYLIGRALVRESSLSKETPGAAAVEGEAEQHLQRVIDKGGKFTQPARKLLNLVKYRVHPQERLHELAQGLSIQGGDNFRQDLTDYNWLIDKFQAQSLRDEESRKEAQKKNSGSTSAGGSDTAVANSDGGVRPDATATPVYDYEKVESGDMLGVSSPVEGDYNPAQFPLDATLEVVKSFYEQRAGRNLTEKESDRLRENYETAKKAAYANKTTGITKSKYEGGYFGDVKPTLQIVPENLRTDELTDWIFTFQTTDDDSYAHALSRWQASNSDLWLMTVLTKANAESPEIKAVLEKAGQVSRDSPAYVTVAFNCARILSAQGNAVAARKFLDAVLNSPAEMPVSARNEFLKLRLKLAENLAEFLKFSQMKAYGFNESGDVGTIDDLKAEQKSWFNPKYESTTREEYDQEVDERFKEEKKWSGRWMIDEPTATLINDNFPVAMLIEVEKSPALPDYLRGRFALAVWVRAILVDDEKTAAAMLPEVVRLEPRFEPLLTPYKTDPNSQLKKDAAIYLIMKNPSLTPYIEAGLGRTDNEFNAFDANDWWCAPYDAGEGPGADGATAKPERPAFLTESQTATARAEGAKLKEIGDAPKYLGGYALAWAKRSPADSRVPEALFITYEANGWTKYGCGNNEELQKTISAYLRRRFPQNEWTRKMNEEEAGKQ